MSCMRCGKESAEDHVFCTECLEDMKRHPVKPGTPIQLPVRANNGPVKRASFRVAESKWHDKIFRLKYTMFWLVVVIILLAGLLALALCMLLQITPEWFNDMFFESNAVQYIISHTAN